MYQFARILTSYTRVMEWSPFLIKARQEAGFVEEVASMTRMLGDT
uniref:Uncharacterized protein n=1 Tax=Arundo donax TaxID=35708 RepID=A0A0A9A1Y6_ARUDO